MIANARTAPTAVALLFVITAATTHAASADAIATVVQPVKG